MSFWSQSWNRLSLRWLQLIKHFKANSSLLSENRVTLLKKLTTDEVLFFLFLFSFSFLFDFFFFFLLLFLCRFRRKRRWDYLTRARRTSTETTFPLHCSSQNCCSNCLQRLSLQDRTPNTASLFNKRNTNLKSWLCRWQRTHQKKKPKTFFSKVKASS